MPNLVMMEGGPEPQTLCFLENRNLISESELDPSSDEDRHETLISLPAEVMEGQQAGGCQVLVLIVPLHNSRRAL
jgi:hypothetical protein